MRRKSVVVHYNNITEIGNECYKSIKKNDCPFSGWGKGRAEIILLNSVGYAKLLDKDTEICLYNTRIIKQKSKKTGTSLLRSSTQKQMKDLKRTDVIRFRTQV